MIRRLDSRKISFTHGDDYDSVRALTAKRSAVLAGGVSGNARLTAMTGVTLLGLLFIEGLTIPAIRALLVPHIFIGFLIVPPLMLKLGSTGYRFVRYYTGNAQYRAAGPPNPLLRLLAPLLVLSVVVLIASGIVLLAAGPQDGPWRRIHILSFIGWFGVMSVHVLAYAGRAARLTWLDLVSGRSGAVVGAITRRSLVLASLLLGVAVALAVLPLDNTWVRAIDVFQPGR
jgi:hypothetical protein